MPMHQQHRDSSAPATRGAAGRASDERARFHDATEPSDEAWPMQGVPRPGTQSRRQRSSRPPPLGEVLARGLVAGAAGVAAMTIAEKLEQTFTRRPDSYVPAHTLERLLGLPARPDEERLMMNWAMHWGQGIALGMVRALMARQGFRGPMGSFLHLNLRLLNDQTLENATGVGAPPWTWPVDEQVVDLLHKAIYAYATGAAADWLVNGPENRKPVKGGHCYE
jgi:hypothetical protein